MNGAIAWFARNHVAANLLMALMIVGGLLAAPSLRQEMFPDVDLDVVTVAVPYPGASPVEVEEGVCVPIEEALQGLAGLKRIRATASEGIATLAVELMSGEDVARRLADIRARVDAVALPEEAERPIVSQAELPRQVLSVAIYGDVDERSLKEIAIRTREELSALPEISEVSLAAVRPYEIAIEVSEAALERHRLSFDQVADAIRRGSLDLPAGVVRAEAGEILLRAQGKARDGEAFARIPVLVHENGTRLTVGDVAHVVDGFAESDQGATFDGKPAALVQVSRVGDQRVIDVAEAARAYVERARGSLPAGVEMVVWQDMSAILAERLGSMKSNAWSGALMVVVVLALFLRLRLAAWVAWGVPTALLGTFALLPLLGVSINWISLMGLVLVLGILVDDAIVVGENTYVEQRRSGSKLEGAIRGARGLAIPVVFGVLTTVAAFVPMLAVPGSMGKLTRALPIVVIVSLLFSLIESLFILPSHLAAGGPVDAPPHSEASRRWRVLQDRVSGGFDAWVIRSFAPFLARALEWRYFALACGVASLMITGALVAGGWLRFTFQEPVDGDVIIADLTMEPGTPAHVTAAALRTIEDAAARVRREADAERDLEHGSIFTHVLTSVGEQPFRDFQASMPNGGTSLGSGGHLGELQVEMIGAVHRDISTSEMQRRWRAALPPLPGVAELSFQNTMVNSGKPIELELRGYDLAQLRAAAAWLEDEIGEYPGVFDAADSFRAGKQELGFGLLPSAESLGITLADVARQVRQAFWGEEVQRLQRGREEVRVVVRYPADERRALGDLEKLRIRRPDGAALPFASVARAELGAGYAAIQRVDRARVVAVTADVDVALGNANAIIADLQQTALPQLAQRFPGVTFGFAGQQAEQRDFLSAMIRGQLFALLAIYALIAVPLRSYTQPIIIMSIIPFGVVGAAVGHLLLGFDLSMYSVIGLVALSGIVVNSSLVLVDQVNALRASGMRLADAAREAAISRIRAIFLTEVTTFVGLIPMMFDTAIAARMTIPLAITLAFGVLFSAVITLVLLPCMYLVLEDATMWASGKTRTRGAELTAESGAARADAEAALE